MQLEKVRRVRASSPIMTTQEVAELLRVHPATVYKLIRWNALPFFKIGSDFRFNREEIEKWMMLQHQKT
jgi:excisionase family DNA binding protein